MSRAEQSVAATTDADRLAHIHTSPPACYLPYSILIGPQALIRKATHFRKLFGGGLRQTGPVVAAARVALEEHFYKLRGTHELAKWMEGELLAMGVEMQQEVETNMVSLDT